MPARKEHAASEEAYGPNHPATLTESSRSPEVEFKQIGPGQFGFVAVVKEFSPIKVKHSDGSTRVIGTPAPEKSVHHGELSSEFAGEEQKGFDTLELPVVHDYNPDA